LPQVLSRQYGKIKTGATRLLNEMQQVQQTRLPIWTFGATAHRSSIGGRMLNYTEPFGAIKVKFTELSG
jgi:hypothetical protein